MADLTDHDHTHQWRATSKVFALVCACGVPYHEWLLTEIEKLKATAAQPMEPFVTQEEVDRIQGDLLALRVSSQKEIEQLRAALSSAQLEGTILRSELEDARRELEVQAEEVTAAIVGA